MDIESAGELNPPIWDGTCFDTTCFHCKEDKCFNENGCNYEPKLRKIELRKKHGKGKYILVDDIDYPIVSLFNWYVLKKGDSYRCTTKVYVDGMTINIHVSRLIMNAPKGKQVDHINHNPLDNRKSNLRICTRSQNLMNMRPRGGTSKYKGVYWCKQVKKWLAGIKINNKRMHIGCFYEEKAAAQAYDIVARKLFGEFAYYNNVGVTHIKEPNAK